MTVYFCLFKQKTAYEMRISDWSSDVCSSDLRFIPLLGPLLGPLVIWRRIAAELAGEGQQGEVGHALRIEDAVEMVALVLHDRSEEHTSELQSLMRISYAVFCLKKKKKQQKI